MLRVDDSPAFLDYSARMYMDACPPAEVAGCTLIVASRAKARYAVTGSVLSLPEGARVQITILDIASSQVLVSFTSDLADGHDAGFAEGVANVLLAAVRGEIGQPGDIRFDDDEAPTPRFTDEQFAAQLGELSAELGTHIDVSDRSGQAIPPPAYTLEDLATHMTDEGVKPWERLGMRPAAYLRFKNSGMDLVEWRARAVGRQLELHLRGFGGWWRGPSEQTFYNRYAYDAALVVADSYSASAVRIGNAATVDAEAAFGILPFLDVGIAVGVAPGRLTVDVASDPAQAAQPEPVVLQQSSGWFGPRACLMFFPVSNIRAGFGGGVSFVHVNAVDRAADVGVQAHVFPAQWLAYAQVYAGGELRVGEHIDLIARVPVDVRVGGSTLREHRDTTNAALVPEPPDHGADVGVGVLVGVQVRLFGRQPPPLRAIEEID